MLLRLTLLTLCASAIWINSDAQIINVEDKRSVFGDTIGLFETLELNANLVKNEEELFSLIGAAQLEFAFKNKLLLSLTKAAFIEAGDENFVNQGFQHLRYNVAWSNWLTYELFGQIQYNELAKIKLRGLAGTGLRFRIMEKDHRRIHYGVSYMYEYDEEAESNIISQDSRMNNYLSFYFEIGEVVAISSTTYFQPLFDEFEDFRIASESEGQFNITKNLKFTTTFTYSFDAKPPLGAPDVLYSWLNGLEYHF